MVEAVQRRLGDTEWPTNVLDDIRRLVIAARIVAFEDTGHEAVTELEKASEAFASLIGWDEEPEPTDPHALWKRLRHDMDDPRQWPPDLVARTKRELRIIGGKEPPPGYVFRDPDYS